METEQVLGEVSSGDRIEGYFNRLRFEIKINNLVILNAAVIAKSRA